MKAARFHRRGFGSVPPSLLAAAVVMALAVFAGCRSEAPAPTDRPVEPPGTASARKIILAVHPYASPVELVRQFTPLLEYLHEQIGQPFVLSVSKDYETHIQLVGGNQADIALMGPASYVAMSEAYGAKRLVCSFEVEGSPRFRGYVIVRKDNPATSVKDLAGKSFASSSRASTMSYVLPRYLFLQAGVPFPEAQLRIVESHNNVCLNVLAGDVTAGGIREKAYLKYKDRGIKVVAVTPEVTEHPFVATDNLDDPTVARIRGALLAIQGPDPVGHLLKPIKSTLTGLVPVEDRDYDPLRAGN